MVNNKELGKKIGFLVGFTLFTSILYFILRFFSKIHSHVEYWHVLLGVIIIYFLGLIFIGK